MELENKKRLWINHKLLVDSLHFSEIEDHLYQNSVLFSNDVELINSQRTRNEKIRALLKIIKKKSPPPDCYVLFCKTLRECAADYGYIADELENADPTAVPDEDVVDGEEMSNSEKITELMTHVLNQTEMLVEMTKKHSQLESHVVELKKELKVATAQNRPMQKENEDVVDSVNDAQFVDNYVVDFMRRSKAGRIAQQQSLLENNKMEIEEVACRLGIDIIENFLQKPRQRKQSTDRYTETMRQMVMDTLDCYGDELRNCVSNMDKIEMDGYRAVNSLGDKLFEDGKDINWGRIVAWYAFWAECTRSINLPENKINESIEFYGKFIGFYIGKRLHGWIEKNGGWDGFVEKYRYDCKTKDSKLFIIMRLLFENFPHRP